MYHRSLHRSEVTFV